MDDLDRFVEGFRRFQMRYFGEDRELFDRLSKQQNPGTLLIGCSDSRVDPAIITQCAPGDMFIVRNVANLVPPFERGIRSQGVSAAIQFAVDELKVDRVVVLGHSQCGGIRALMQGRMSDDPDDFLGRWMRIAEPAKQKVLTDLPNKSAEVQRRAAELAAILVSLDNLLTFPWLKQRVEQGALSLHGWYFDFDQGALLGYDPEAQHFQPLVCPLDQPY